MGWRGTAIGGALGLAFGGPLGGVVGAALGHGAERIGRRLRLFPNDAGADSRRAQQAFFDASFSVMGQVAKADGRVSEAEIEFAESVMDRMGLAAPLRRAAIERFNQGKSHLFDLDAALRGLHQAGVDRGPLGRIFLELQAGLAYADGPPSPEQARSLERVRRALGIPAATLRRIERLVIFKQRILEGMYGGPAGASRGYRTTGQAPRESALSGAYATLGLDPGASDAEVKRAYRRLMSQHHPDKLASRGLPEEAMRLASQRTQEIRRAYEQITRSRTG